MERNVYFLCLGIALKKSKMEASFSEDEKSCIIDAIRRYPSLWDERATEYKDAYERNSAWRKVVEDVELDLQRSVDLRDVQKQFKNLRDTYVRKKRELRMQLARCTGAAAVENVRRRAGNWSYWKMLNFLDPVIDTGARYTNVDEDIEVLQEDDSPTTSQNSRSSIERQKSRRTNALMEGLASALKQTEDVQLDRFDVACMNLAHSLRAIAELNPTRAGYWKVKLEELHLEISKEELKLKMEEQLHQ